MTEFIAGIVVATIFWQIVFARCISLGANYMIEAWYDKTVCIVIASVLYFVLYAVCYSLLVVTNV